MKNSAIGTVLALALLSADKAAALTSETLTASWTGSQVIPDHNASGVAFPFDLSTSSPMMIADVTVGLNLSGGWNGDLYATLSHSGGFAVLLNRIGRTSANPGGSAVGGLNLQLADSHLTDVHLTPANPLVGNFAPDGRFANPFTAVDTDPRTALLGSFTGLDPNGTWTLFFADVSPLATATLQGWSVNVIAVVPEPGSASLVALALSLGVLTRKLRG